MSTGSKKKHAKFTFQSLIRLIIFSLVIFLIISFVSGQNISSPKKMSSDLPIGEEQSNFVLGKTTEISNNVYQSIPENSRKQLENLGQSQAVIYVQNQINLIKNISQGFPQKQIKEIQKMVVNNIYQNTIRNIDSK